MLNVLLIVTTMAMTDLAGSNFQFNRVQAGEYATVDACEAAGDAITEPVFYKVPVDENGQTKIVKIYTNQSYQCVDNGIVND